MLKRTLNVPINYWWSIAVMVGHGGPPITTVIIAKADEQSKAPTSVMESAEDSSAER